MGTLIVFVLVPMSIYLLRNRPIRVPKGFDLWLLVLLWVAVSITSLRWGKDGPSSRITGPMRYLVGRRYRLRRDCAAANVLQPIEAVQWTSC